MVAQKAYAYYIYVGILGAWSLDMYVSILGGCHLDIGSVPFWGEASLLQCKSTMRHDCSFDI